MNDAEDLFAGAQGEPEATRKSVPLVRSEIRTALSTGGRSCRGKRAKRKDFSKVPDLRVLLIGLRPGTHIAEHKAAGSISVQVITGHLLIRAAGRVFDLHEGQFLTLEREIPHDLEALAESAVLVTIAWQGAERL